MRRSAWIFFASIFLPSLGLAWLAIRSVQDQQVVLEHQQVIISQNITDTLAKNVQDQMDAVRADFVKTTQALLDENPPPENLARDFNQKIHAAWPMAEIGFAVNLNGQIYSPKLYDDQDARMFRNENGRFLTNRENVEVYSNSFNIANNAGLNSNSSFGMKLQAMATNGTQETTAVQGGTIAGQLYRGDAGAAAPAGIDALASQKQINEPVLQLNKEEAGKFKGATLTLSSNNIDAAKKISIPVAPANSAPVVINGSGNIAPAAAMEAGADAQGKADMAPALDIKAATKSLTAQHSNQSPAADKTRNLANEKKAMAKDGADSASLNSDSVVSSPAAMPPPATVSVPTPTAKPTAKAIVTARPMSPIAQSPTSTARSSSGAMEGYAAVTAPAAAAPSDESQAMRVPAQNAQATDLPTPQENADLMDRVEAKMQKVQRQVIPQRTLTRDSAPVSNTLPADSDFRRIIGTDTSGELARFLENKLRLIVWSHATVDAPIVFGAQLDQARLVEALQSSLQIPNVDIRTSYDRVSTNYCTAILDDTGHPVAVSRPGFVADWKHPFVATEIGEVLPHWEAALYQVDPHQISHAARTVQWTIGFIVLLLVAAIIAGGSLIAADVRKQVRLAQQKTDFVSNVSHELKTPLTSIRMFADLLAEKRVPDEERQATYLRIIAAEASRLTRLINNVLDFARLERGAKNAAPGEHRACDLVEAVRDVIDTCGPHLEAAGITFRHEIEADALPIQGDRDALAQIILNLVSNAEKYGGSDVLVRARRQDTASGVLGCVDVLDRGAGIPAREVKTIFEPFQRLDDSLSSGIPGSGLGLTLARRMARAHSGDVTYSARAGGGSCFTLTIPLEKISA